MDNHLDRRRLLAVLGGTMTGLALEVAGVSLAESPADGPRVEADFECGGGKRLRRIAPDHWRMETSGDQSFFTKYFCVRVTPGPNGAPAKLRLDVYPDSEFGDRGRQYFASHFPSYIWSLSGNWPRRAATGPAGATALMQGIWGAGERWVPLQNARPDSVVFHDEFLELHVDLSAGKPVYVASNPPYRYSDLVQWCQALAAAHPKRVEVTRLGITPEGREIPLLRLRGSNAKVRFLVIAGQHPAEHGGVWAAKGLVEYVLSSISEAKLLADGLDLAVMPMMNPDGNVHGLSGANSQGIDLCKEWTGTSKATPPKSAESRLLWEWIRSEFQPDLFLNLHSGLGWRELADPPYDGAILFAWEADRFYQDPARAAAFCALRDRLAFQTPGVVNTAGGGMALTEEFLDYHLAAEFQTLAVLYHVNGGSVGALSQYRLGAQLFSAMAQAVLSDAPLR